MMFCLWKIYYLIRLLCPLKNCKHIHFIMQPTDARYIQYRAYMSIDRIETNQLALVWFGLEQSTAETDNVCDTVQCGALVKHSVYYIIRV